MVMKFITKIFPDYHLSSVSNFVNKLELKKKTYIYNFCYRNTKFVFLAKHTRKSLKLTC